MTRGTIAFADLAVKDLFPTPIWTLDVRPDVMQEMNPRLLDAILGLMTPRPALRRIRGEELAPPEAVG